MPTSTVPLQVFFKKPQQQTSSLAVSKNTLQCITQQQEQEQEQQLADGPGLLRCHALHACTIYPAEA